MSKKMEKVDIFGAVMNCGDGSAYVRWYLSKEQAEKRTQILRHRMPMRKMMTLLSLLVFV
jgi:hypothetical protein